MIKRSSGKVRLILIWEELFRLDSIWQHPSGKIKMTLYICNNISAWEAHVRLEGTCPL